MCPHLVVKAGGAAGGGSGGGGAGAGGGGAGGGPGGGGAGAGDGSPSAATAAPDGHKGKASAACPIDVATGAMFTIPLCDGHLPGPIDVRWMRQYRTTAARLSCGIGHGWWHSYAWRARMHPREVELIDGHGIHSRHPAVDDGAEVDLAFGRRLARRGTKLLLADTTGDVRIFAPHPCGWLLLVEVRDRHGNAVLIHHDAQGAVRRVDDAVGRSIVREVDGQMHRFVALATDAHGREHRRPLVTYEIDERGDLVRSIDPEGHAWEYRYDDRHYMVREARPDGVRFHFVYERRLRDGRRRCLETWGDLADGDILLALGREQVPSAEPDGPRPKGIFHTRFEYGPEPNDTTVTEGDGGLHRYVGNSLGLIEAYVDPQGYVTTLSFDARGNITERVGPDGQRTTTEWTSDSLLSSVTDHQGHRFEVDRDEEGWIVEVRSPLASWSYEYDDARNLRTLREPGGAAVHHDHDARGQRVRSVLADGTTIDYRYDGHGNLVEVVGTDGRHLRYGYDLFGQPVHIETKRGASWQMQHDARGFTTRIVGPGGKTVHYQLDSVGRPLRVTRSDGTSLERRYVGDALVEVVRESGQRLRYGFDVLLRGIWIENGAGEIHEVRRRLDGAIVRERTFAGVESRLRYDPAGRIERVQREDESFVDYAYDQLGRLASIDADGRVDAFEYDAVGQLTRAQGPDADVRLTRDPAGRVLEEEVMAADWRYRVSRERDAIGRVLRTHYSTGWQVGRSFAPDGDVATLTLTADGEDATIQLARDEHGAQVQTRLGAKVITTTRDPLGRPTSVDVSRGGAPLRQRQFTWSDKGPLDRVEDSAGGVRVYELDAAGRPTKAQGLGEQSERRYSPHGTPVTADAKLGANGRVEQTAQGRFSWDRHGRLTSTRTDGTTWSFRYDARDRLVEARRDDGCTVRNLYDPFGRRVAQDIDGTTTWFGWDQDAPVEEVRTEGVATRRVFVPGTTTPLAEWGADHWRLVASDHVGTPWLLVGDDDVGELELSVAGDVVHQSGQVTRLRFAGQRADDLTGLSYHRFRYYAPATGQFTSSDPLGLPASLQDVAYVDNPTWQIDPLGLVVVCFSDDQNMIDGAKLQAARTGQPYLHGKNLGPNTLAGANNVDVVTHGDQAGMLQLGGDGSASGSYVPAADVGKMLKGAGFQGMQVNVLACNAANPPAGGGDSAAQQIADETGANVTAPNNLLYHYGRDARGQYSTSAPGFVGGPPPARSPYGGWHTTPPRAQAGRPQPPPAPARIPPGYDPYQPATTG